MEKPKEQSLTAEDRPKWSNKMEYMLAVVGFVVDLSNIWRFPYLCYAHGGGAFLVAYLVIFLLAGLPMFYMELAIGQFFQKGCLSVWDQLCPMLKGIGIAICIVTVGTGFFYNTVIAWSVYMLILSFRRRLMFADCHNWFNTPLCYDVDGNGTMIGPNGTNVTAALTNQSVLPAEEFFERMVVEIHKSDSLWNLGTIKWELLLCLIFVLVLTYFAIWKGPKSTGKAVWITATLPYITLLILLIRGVTLPGAWNGIKAYFNTDLTKLGHVNIWVAAASQVFFSLGIGFGVLIAFSSYNSFHNNCYKDAMIAALINASTSFVGCFALFSVLGYMAHVLKVKVTDVVGEGGPGLIFVVYPQALATMIGSVGWAILFFVMMITLGLDSVFGAMEGLTTSLMDQFPKSLGRKRELTVFAVMVITFLGSLSTVTNGGPILVDFIDHYAVSLPLIVLVGMQAVTVCWIYGTKKFVNNLTIMLGKKPHRIWSILWTYVSPLVIWLIVIMATWEDVRVPLEGYPDWSIYVGWLIRMASLVWIPVYALIYYVLHRLKQSHQHVANSEKVHSGKSQETSSGSGAGFSLKKIHPTTTMMDNNNGNNSMNINRSQLDTYENSTTIKL